MLKKLFSPFRVPFIEHSIFLWFVAILIIAPLGAWLSNKILDSFTNIFTLTLSLSLMAPMIIDIIINSIINNKLDEKEKFLTHKKYAIASFILILIVFFIIFHNGEENSVITNIAISIISIFFSFYLYCLSKMHIYTPLNIYDQKPYDFDKNRQELNEKAKKTKTILDGVKV